MNYCISTHFIFHVMLIDESKIDCDDDCDD